MNSDFRNKIIEKANRNPVLTYLGNNYYKITIYGSILLVLLSFSYIFAFNNVSGDYKVYINAAESFSQGENPYNSTIGNLEDSNHNFVYPPITIPFFQIFLFVSNLTSVFISHYVIYSLILIFSGVLIYRSEEDVEYKYLTVILLGSFSSNYWAFMGGNADIMALPISSILFYGVIKKKSSLSSVLAGVLSTIKFIHFPPVFLFLFNNRDLKGKLKPILSGVFALIGTTLTGFLIFPKLSSSYISQFFEQKGSNWLVEWSSDGMGGNSIGHLIGDLISPLTKNPEIILGIYVLWTLFVFSMMISYFIKFDDFYKKLAFGTLSYLAVMPSELNAATLALGIPSLYMISKDYTRVQRTFIVILTVFLPYIATAIRGLVLPLGDIIFSSGLAFFAMHMNKISLIGILIFEIRLQNVGLASYKDFLKTIEVNSHTKGKNAE